MIMTREEPRVELVFETGERVACSLTSKFLERIRFIITEQESGYSDVPDLVRAALRTEVDRAEKGLYGRRRK